MDSSDISEDEYFDTLTHAVSQETAEKIARQIASEIAKENNKQVNNKIAKENNKEVNTEIIEENTKQVKQQIPEVNDEESNGKQETGDSSDDSSEETDEESNILDEFYIDNDDDDEEDVPLNERMNNQNDNTTNDLKSDEDGDTKTPSQDELEAIKDEERRVLEDDISDEILKERYDTGMQLKVTGNEFYQDSDLERSLEQYSAALEVMPVKHTFDRSRIHSNRSTVYLKLKKIEDSIKDCSSAIRLDDSFSKPLLRRAHIYETDTDKLESALADYELLLTYNKNIAECHDRIPKLKTMISKRNDEMKEEMMGKLKDLGNLCLKPFGLSTNNFKMQQDPNTGSYSINFQQ